MARKKQVKKVAKTEAKTEAKAEVKTEGKMAQEKMTERVITVVLTLVIAGVLGVVGTALSGGALIGALGGVQETEPAFDQRVGNLGARVEALQAKIEGATRVPAGAVMAFDLSNGCPDGWTEFADAAGRTIIGQGSGMVDENGQPLTGRKYRGHGGEEKHTLTVEEMPAHDHKYTWQILADGGNFQHVWASTHSKKFPNDPGRADGLTKTTKTGGQSDGTTKRHNNMPPFIALYFCKKV